MTIEQRVTALFKTAEETGITNVAIAQRTGISKWALSRWRVGKNMPKLHNIIKAEKALVKLLEEAEQ